MTFFKQPIIMIQTSIRILGIDPGSRSTGFGVIDLYGREIVYVASGCIKTIPQDELAGRISIIARHIGEIIDTYQPSPPTPIGCGYPPTTLTGAKF